MTTVPRSRDLVLAWKQAATNMEDLHVALRTLTKLQTVNHVLRLHTIHARRRPADNVADLAHCQHRILREASQCLLSRCRFPENWLM